MHVGVMKYGGEIMDTPIMSMKGSRLLERKFFYEGSFHIGKSYSLKEYFPSRRLNNWTPLALLNDR